MWRKELFMYILRSHSYICESGPPLLAWISHAMSSAWSVICIISVICMYIHAFMHAYVRYEDSRDIHCLCPCRFENDQTVGSWKNLTKILWKSFRAQKTRSICTYIYSYWKIKDQIFISFYSVILMHLSLRLDESSKIIWILNFAGLHCLNIPSLCTDIDGTAMGGSQLDAADEKDH